MWDVARYFENESYCFSTKVSWARSEEEHCRMIFLSVLYGVLYLQRVFNRDPSDISGQRYIVTLNGNW